MGKEFLVSNGQELGWDQEFMWMLWRREGYLACAMNGT
jgi:hypothetical protein